MTLYRDMTNAELVETALNWRVKSGQECQKRIIYALAKRLEEVTPEGKYPGEDIERLETPNRPRELHKLYAQKGLSREAVAWLKAYRPEVWRECQLQKSGIAAAASIGLTGGPCPTHRTNPLYNEGMGAANLGALAASNNF